MEFVNFILALSFVVEMVLKLFALHVKAYFKDPFNVFDFCVVAVSIFEIAYTPPSFLVRHGSSARSFVSILRTFRLLRVFKLARYVPELRVARWE